MRVLMLHNEYMVRGGEDDSTAAEEQLLRQHRVELETYRVCNSQISKQNRLGIALGAIWSRAAYHAVRQQVRRFRPDVVHVQNFFPLLSPAVYYAARREGASVVQTLRNYRLMCANGLFFRNGHVCEDCVGRLLPWPAVLHRCYRESVVASGTVAAMLTVHRTARTWSRCVDIYIALTDFARQKFVLAGFPTEKLAIKPNFVFGPDRTDQADERYTFVYAGRLSAEKGLNVLLNAWEQAAIKTELLVAGTGPLATQLPVANESKRVRYLGHSPSENVGRLIGHALALVVPSLVYEGMPRTILQAFAAGTPVIVPSLGGMAEMVDSGRTGLHFAPGDAHDLARKLQWAWDHADKMRKMGQNAHREYLEKYTAERNYRTLIEIYRRALENRDRAHA